MKIISANTLKPFDWFLIIGIIVLSITHSILSNEFDYIGTIAGISGVLCVVLVAKRSMANYIFGIINVSLYAYIAYLSRLYGDFILNAFYYLPMQFIGWYLWSKARGGKNYKGEVDESIVKSVSMNFKQRVLLFVVSILLVLLFGWLLDNYTVDQYPYKDSATTVLSIIAMFLMVKKYAEQWFLWIGVNTISIIIWVLFFIDGKPHSGFMVLMWVFYLANSINGSIVWTKAAKSSKE